MEIYGIKLSQAPFINLNKLISLTLENCDLSEFHIDSLYSLPSLFVLRIGEYKLKECFKNITYTNYEIDNLYNLNEIKIFKK